MITRENQMTSSRHLLLNGMHFPSLSVERFYLYRVETLSSSSSSSYQNDIDPHIRGSMFYSSNCKTASLLPSHYTHSLSLISLFTLDGDTL